MPEQTKKFVEMGRKMKLDIENMLGRDTVLIFPDYPTTAPYHDVPRKNF